MNARNQLLNSKAPLTFNEFGGSFGGPIRKNRIFIFGDYEGYREAAFAVVQGTVPTLQTRNALLAAVPSYNLTLDIEPLPNQPTAANAATGTYLAARTGRHTNNQVDVKGDVMVTDSSRLSLTYSRGRPYQLVPAIFVGGANDRSFSAPRARRGEFTTERRGHRNPRWLRLERSAAHGSVLQPANPKPKEDSRRGRIPGISTSLDGARRPPAMDVDSTGVSTEGIETRASIR